MCEYITIIFVRKCNHHVSGPCGFGHFLSVTMILYTKSKFSEAIGELVWCRDLGIRSSEQRKGPPSL